MVILERNVVVLVCEVVFTGDVDVSVLVVLVVGIVDAVGRVVAVV